MDMQPQVILYTSANSAYCEEMRQLLVEQGVVFTEKAVEDAGVSAELKGLVGDEVVPVTVIYTNPETPQMVIGHDRQRLLSLLEGL
jgi:hypothetical protein